MPAIQRSEFALALNQVSNERGFDPEVILEAVRNRNDQIGHMARNIAERKISRQAVHDSGPHSWKSPSGRLKVRKACGLAPHGRQVFWKQAPDLPLPPV